MTTKDKAARRKLSLLELAKELDNVSRACKELRFPIHPVVEPPCSNSTSAISAARRANPFGDRPPGAPKGSKNPDFPLDSDCSMNSALFQCPSSGSTPKAVATRFI